MSLPQLLQARASSSKDRLQRFASGLADYPAATAQPDLCLYVTGSFGRLEASQYSDLDLFFIQTSKGIKTDIGRIPSILMSADLIRLARTHKYPEFSRDGEFLKVHQLRDILDHLGSPEDDHRNLFTARMLLLLESRPVHNQPVYDDAIQKIVGAYFRDYHDHSETFRPVFFANDLIRFWKTLCLNYEHRRNRPTTDPEKKASSHLKNLKLKFSRMSTCYSSVVWLAAQSQPPGPEGIIEMARLTPSERFDRISEILPKAKATVAELFDHYEWFLTATGKPEAEAAEWIADRGNRDAAFERARHFGLTIYKLLTSATEGKDLLRYLLV